MMTCDSERNERDTDNGLDLVLITMDWKLKKILILIVIFMSTRYVCSGVFDSSILIYKNYRTYMKIIFGMFL